MRQEEAGRLEARSAGATEKETPIIKIPKIKKWIIAARPWALPASTMPVIFGTSLAVVIGRVPLDLLRFLLAFLAMIVLHSAANMLSDVFDFKHGLDKNITPVSGALVRGWLGAGQVAAGSIALFILGSALGLLLVRMTGTVLFYIGAAGVVIGALYTVLKAHALGDLAVFLNFGIMGSLGAWVVQTRSFSWLPVIWTVPMAMLVSAILHANNWRDMVTDREKKIVTTASLLKDRGSLAYYSVLLFGSMTIILLYTVLPRLMALPLPALPLTFIIVLAAFPRALVLWKRARKRHAPEKPMDFIILDGATANYNLLFGLLGTAALWLDVVLRKIGVLP